MSRYLNIYHLEFSISPKLNETIKLTQKKPKAVQRSKTKLNVKYTTETLKLSQKEKQIEIFMACLPNYCYLINLKKTIKDFGGIFLKVESLYRLKNSTNSLNLQTFMAPNVSPPKGHEYQ